MNAEIITAIALGIGLSASTGFRVFIPMLVASIATNFKILPTADNFYWLGSNVAMISFGVATIIEVLAYYIPLVDNLLDTITTPLAIVAGTLLMTSVLPIDSELLRWIAGFIIGGGSAVTIQGGTVLTRLTSSKLTVGSANPVVSTAENVVALGSSIMTLFLPIFVAIIFLMFGLFIFRKTYNKRARKKWNSKYHS